MGYIQVIQQLLQDCSVPWDSGGFCVMTLMCLSSDYASFDPRVPPHFEILDSSPLHNTDFPPLLQECLLSVLLTFPSLFNHWEFCPDLLSVCVFFLNFIHSPNQPCCQRWCPALTFLRDTSVLISLLPSTTAVTPITLNNRVSCSASWPQTCRWPSWFSCHHFLNDGIASISTKSGFVGF